MQMDSNDITEIIKSLPTITASVAAFIASIVAIRGINSWRREFMGKRDIELAEEVLELFHKAQTAIKAIRSPLGYMLEGQKVLERLKKEGNEQYISSKAAVLFERFEDREEVFHKLQALRYRFMAHFGKDKVKPFDDLKQIVDKMFISAKMLSIMQESKKDGEIGNEDKPSVNEKIREYEADLTWGDTEKDKITPMLEEVGKQIDKIYQEIIGDRYRAQIVNVKRGFKRITLVLGIVIAIACGIIVGFLPVQQYRYARANWWGVNDPLVIRPPTEKDLAEFEIWQQDNKVIIDSNSYVIDDTHSSNKQTLMTVCNNYFENQRKRFCYNLPIAKLIGMVALCGLGGAAAGYLGTWVIIWCIGYIPIRWIILGFTKDYLTDKQKQ
jgi:hypothetical protein